MRAQTPLAEAHAGKVDPVVGRAEEIEREQKRKQSQLGAREAVGADLDDDGRGVIADEEGISQACTGSTSGGDSR